MYTPTPPSAGRSAADPQSSIGYNPSPEPLARTAAAAPPAGGRWWATLLVAVALFLFFAPAYLRHMALSGDPNWFNPDAGQQIWALLRYHDGRLFQNDVVAEYYLATFPVGYRTLYAVLGPVWDARGLSKVLPYLLLAATAWAAGRAARRVRGPAAAWATVALCLGASIYLSRMAGGLPRSFAFPLLAVAALALCRGKPLLLAGTTVVAGALYPSAAVVTGLALAGWLLMPGRWLGKADEWGWGRRLIVLAVAAGLTVGMLLPTLLASADYGPLLRPSDVGQYPELSSTGRYHDEDRVDEGFSARAVRNFINAPLAGIGGEWDPSAAAGLTVSPRLVYLLLLAALGLAGFGLLVRTSPPARRLLLLPAAGIAAYLVAVPLVPLLYLPTRYQLYPLALAALIIVPTGLAHLATAVIRHTDQRRTQALALLAAVGPYVLLFSAWDVVGPGSRGLSNLSSAGLTRHEDDHAAAYAFLMTLKPQSTLLAGWPEDLSDVPYVTGRSVLLTRDAHHTLHKLYADLTRGRMNRLVGALYGADVKDLVSLQSVDGAAVLRALQAADLGSTSATVTHLVINPSLLYGPNPPTHPIPSIDATVRASRLALGNKTPAPLQAGLKVVFSQPGEDWVVIELPKRKVEE
jgi:hypothetical protein